MISTKFVVINAEVISNFFKALIYPSLDFFSKLKIYIDNLRVDSINL